MHKLLLVFVFVGLNNCLFASECKALQRQTTMSKNQDSDAKLTTTKYIVLAYAAGAINFNELVAKIFNQK